MMKNEIIVDLPVPVYSEGQKTDENKLDKLALRLGHEKSGYGGFDWNFRKGGHKLYLSPCRIVIREGGFSSRQSILLSGDKWASGFYMLINEAERKNPHFIKRAMAKLEERKERIAVVYSNKDGETLKTLISELND